MRVSFVIRRPGSTVDLPFRLLTVILAVQVTSHGLDRHPQKWPYLKVVCHFMDRYPQS